MIWCHSHRDLDIIVSSNLSWSFHYSKICKAAYNALHLIKRNLTPTADVSTRRSLYLALVRSKLSYCSQLSSPWLLRIQLLLKLYSAELLSIFYPPLQYRTGITLSSCGYFLWFTGLTFRTCSFWSNVFCFHQITLIIFLMCHFASQVLARVPQGNCFFLS